LIAALSIAGFLIVVAAAFFWRLSNGPVSIDFLTTRIETEINQSLTGMSVKVSGALFELDEKSGVPQFRLRDMILLDQNGNQIARSAKAAISFETSSLLIGAFVPKSLEFIGSRMFVKRQLSGELTLGFGSPPAPVNETVTMEETDGEDGGQTAQPPVLPQAAAKSVIDMLAGTAPDSAANTLEDIRISGASIQFFDEANQSNWTAPEADLTFRRMPYGFVIFAKATVASGPTFWKTEFSANYKVQSRSFAISARIDDLVPANVSDKIFALAQFAKVAVPLSGHAELEISDTGVVTSGSAEFTAAAGVLGLPDFLAQPIVIDEGALRVDYDPETGGVNIIDSVILVGGSKAELTGRVDPVRAADGRLSDLKIELKATNVSVDTQGTVKDPVLVDRVEFAGSASIEGATLEISDLVVMSGNAGVRMRGKLTGGEESTGISLQGRVRDVSADFLKKLWPPIVAPKSRAWVSENIKAGRMTEGVFNINIPPDGLAKAQREKLLPDDNIEFKFSLAEVNANYFKTLPILKDGSGSAELRGDSFELSIDSGHIDLPSLGVVQVRRSMFRASSLLAAEVPGLLALNLTAGAAELMELASQPSLGFLNTGKMASLNLSGEATAKIDIRLPLIKDVPRDRVETNALIKIANAGIQKVVPNIDLTEGAITVISDQQGTKLEGPIKINGFPAKISWQRARGPNAQPVTTVVAELDDEARDKLGLKLGSVLQGTAKVSAEITGIGEGATAMHVKADLSKAEIQVDAIKWTRPPTDSTTATFTYRSSPETGRKVENLIVRGQGLSIKGDVVLASDGALKSAKFSQIALGDESNFTMTMEPIEGGEAIAIGGKSFDARAMIKSMFSSGPQGSGKADSKQNLNITAKLDRVYAHRGEVLTGVSASLAISNGLMAAVEIDGNFASGAPLTVHVRPADKGRLLQVVSGDAGAALRAANLYSKVSGGRLELSAALTSKLNSTIQNGQLIIRKFDVKNEATIAEIDNRSKAKKAGQKRDGLSFKRLTVPFTADAEFVRIGDSLIRGDDLGATAEGVIRKSDGAIDITGTIIPAYGLNSFVGNIPLLGAILTGGKGEGIFGLAYAMGGTMAKPKFQINPVSALAPGILRKFFEFDASGKPTRIKQDRDD
jgi:Protein of unknown function/AsmA-like C-terminal region